MGNDGGPKGFWFWALKCEANFKIEKKIEICLKFPTKFKKKKTKIVLNDGKRNSAAFLGGRVTKNWPVAVRAWRKFSVWPPKLLQSHFFAIWNKTTGTFHWSKNQLHFPLKCFKLSPFQTIFWLILQFAALKNPKRSHRISRCPQPIIFQKLFTHHRNKSETDRFLWKWKVVRTGTIQHIKYEEEAANRKQRAQTNRQNKKKQKWIPFQSMKLNTEKWWKIDFALKWVRGNWTSTSETAGKCICNRRIASVCKQPEYCCQNLFLMNFERKKYLFQRGEPKGKNFFGQKIKKIHSCSKSRKNDFAAIFGRYDAECQSSGGVLRSEF